MSKITRTWLIVATALLSVGVIMFASLMTALNWDFSKLNTEKYHDVTHEIREDFNNISISVDTSDIVIVPSTCDNTKIVCHEQEKLAHTVEVVDGVLNITTDDARKWYDHISIFSFTSPKITIHLPKAEYKSLTIKADTGDVKITKDFTFENIKIETDTGDVTNSASVVTLLDIETDTGDVRLNNLSAGEIKVSTSTGDLDASQIRCDQTISLNTNTGDFELVDVNCTSLTSLGDTGDLTIKQVVASEKIYITRDTGDVELYKSDANEIYIKTDTGDVEGVLLSEKVFTIKTDTGDVRVPNSSSGGKCEIITDTGDIEIFIAIN